MRPKDDHWEDNSKKAENVENEDQPFKFGKPAAYDGIDRDAEQDDSPEEQYALPGVRLIARIGKNNQTLCHRPVQVSDRSAEGLPSEDC